MRKFFADAPTVILEQGQTTTLGTLCPTLCDKCLGFLTSPADHNKDDAEDGTYGLSSLSEKTICQTICRWKHCIACKLNLYSFTSDFKVTADNRWRQKENYFTFYPPSPLMFCTHSDTLQFMYFACTLLMNLEQKYRVL